MFAYVNMILCSWRDAEGERFLCHPWCLDSLVDLLWHQHQVADAPARQRLSEKVQLLDAEKSFDFNDKFS